MGLKQLFKYNLDMSFIGASINKTIYKVQLHTKLKKMDGIVF